VKRTSYEAPHYAVFSSLPPFPSSLLGPNIPLSTLSLCLMIPRSITLSKREITMGTLLEEMCITIPNLKLKLLFRPKCLLVLNRVAVRKRVGEDFLDVSSSLSLKILRSVTPERSTFLFFWDFSLSLCKLFHFINKVSGGSNATGSGIMFQDCTKNRRNVSHLSRPRRTFTEASEIQLRSLAATSWKLL